ncbi:MAG: ornithine carbamoyltransferase [Firmicutes bacterium]|nr:ornithine carbamoyltransferase [Bacillota bacterium]
MSEINFKGRDFISLADYTREELFFLLEQAKELKKNPLQPLLAGKNLALLFEKPSVRTRVSFEVGMNQLGGSAIMLPPEQVQLGKRESVADVAKVLSRYVDGIMVRTFAHSTILELAENADVPVINGLTDLLHPCQVLADLFTIWEKKGKLEGLKLVYLGDGSNNMAHSLMLGGAIMGLEVVIASSGEYRPDQSIAAKTQELSAKYGGRVSFETDPQAAARSADILYTDVWASMGQESEANLRRKVLAKYQLNQALLECAKPDCLVMHCLPAHYGEEITLEVAQSANSVIYDQAENRLHAQKAVLVQLLG